VRTAHVGNAAVPLPNHDKTAHAPPPPDEEYFLMTFFGFLVLGLYFLGKIARKKPPNQ
jgi:hypothetical protein